MLCWFCASRNTNTTSIIPFDNSNYWMVKRIHPGKYQKDNS
jgi:hypothetical protein